MTTALRRLKQRAEFLRVASARRKWNAPGFVLQAGPNERGDIGFGLTASRKVGPAVTRNRARRRLREAARIVLPQLGQPGFDYVLIARSETPRRDFQELLADLQRAVPRVSAAPKQAARPDGAT